MSKMAPGIVVLFMIVIMGLLAFGGAHYDKKRETACARACFPHGVATCVTFEHPVSAKDTIVATCLDGRASFIENE